MDQSRGTCSEGNGGPTVFGTSDQRYLERFPWGAPSFHNVTDDASRTKSQGCTFGPRYNLQTRPAMNANLYSEKNRKNEQQPALENADIVPYPLLLVLCNALRYPRNVADFL